MKDKFKMPILMYDGIEVYKSDKKALEEDVELEMVPHVIGYIKLPPKEIVAYHDCWKRGTPFYTIAKDGFDSTMVFTKTLGEFHCSWRMEKFERMLEEHCKNSIPPNKIVE